uniref:phosphoenolpyruvate carboxykinase (ATP) n=1 Tax=Lotharella globosa TaxID=91324 RepID=A0A6V3K747_9EUKA
MAFRGEQKFSSVTDPSIFRQLKPSKPDAFLDHEEMLKVHKHDTTMNLHLDTSLLEPEGIHPDKIYRNSSVGLLYEHACKFEKGSIIASNGALVAYSGDKRGRCPLDKRVVDEPTTSKDVWWGAINIKLPEASFMTNRERAIDYLNTRDRLYVIDAFGGADPKYRLKVRVITSRAYHALFMHNMLIRPTEEELANFGDPDFTIFNAGEFPANRYTEGMTSSTSVSLSFARRELVILGTQYAGEMKKGLFTLFNYLMPKQGVLSMHASANEGKDGDVSIFFGLSGTGKTTLSSDPERLLIGDDEHCWTDDGVFNIEGGCYAKAINLSREQEPDIYDAAKFGAVLENVKYDLVTRDIDYKDNSLTENTRLSYPIFHIHNAKDVSMGPLPKNVIMLTCDAFGVLPPVSKLTPEQAMYHFMSGYTAKVAGTEVGVKEPSATFSACFGAPFIVWHPSKYAELLAEKVQKDGAHCWLVNTGWTGGPYGEGKRLSLKYTRSIIDGIHHGDLEKAEYETLPIFNLAVPKSCPKVPSDILNPRNTWDDKAAHDRQANHLANLFIENFRSFEEGTTQAILDAAPTPQ